MIKKNFHIIPNTFFFPPSFSKEKGCHGVFIWRGERGVNAYDLQEIFSKVES